MNNDKEEITTIRDIKNQGILGKVIGCRVNGGGLNRMFITTHTGQYIVGGKTILTKTGNAVVTAEEACYHNPEGSIISVWETTELTDIKDIEFCTKLESEGYDFCWYGGYFGVTGCDMEQLHIQVKECSHV